jgi:hypothetical protein
LLEFRILSHSLCVDDDNDDGDADDEMSGLLMNTENKNFFA